MLWHWQRRRERPTTSWLDGLTPEKAIRATADRNNWTRLVHDAANRRIARTAKKKEEADP